MLPAESSACKKGPRGRVCVCVCARQSICHSHSILSGAALIFHNKFQFEAFAFGIHMHTINFSLAAHFYLPIKIIPRQCCLYAAASVTTPCLLLLLLHLLLCTTNLLSALANCSAFKYKLFAFFPSAAGRAALKRSVHMEGEGGRSAKPIARQCVAFKLHIEL